MTWRSRSELSSSNTDEDFRTKFIKLYVLSEFFNLGLVSKDYKPADVLEEAITLTTEGANLAAPLQEGGNISLPEIKLVLLQKFYHHDLFIDLATTNISETRKILNDEIVSGTRKFPWVYDRLLYDRFFDMFPNPRTSLEKSTSMTYEDTIRFLENTPQGVFQIQKSVVGSFGILDSLQSRYLPPRLKTPLWHCEDSTCPGIHVVSFSPGACKVNIVSKRVSRFCEATLGPSSEWKDFFDIIISKSSLYYRDVNTGHLPWLLGNAFSEKELREILRLLIEQHSEIRQCFPEEEMFRASGETISKRLSKPQCLQLILIATDEAITHCLENLIKKQILSIPPTEVRATSYGNNSIWFPGVYGYGRSVCVCSQFGVRFSHRQGNIAPVKLKLLLRELYNDEIDQLEWRLRQINGESVYEKLDEYIYKEDPKRIIKELVFDTPSHLKQAFNFLRYGFFEYSAAEEEMLIEKILWKLGFDIRLYPPHQPLFWDRLNKLLLSANTGSPYSEPDREKIRSIGVNFFVSLEEILEYCLTFSTWALLSDHFGKTKFKYDFDEAREFMASQLSGRLQGPNGLIVYDASGKNTLQPLIDGFKILADVCEEFLEQKENLARSESELPMFCNKITLIPFPFLHKALILDLREADYSVIIKFLKEIPTTLNRAQVCNVRNRIDHKGRKFPSQEEIETACEAIAEIVERMELMGLSPLIFLASGTVVDEYGRSYMMLKDYKGNVTRVIHPSTFAVSGIPSLRNPVILVPAMHLGESSELMRFSYQEKSEYVKMWEDYPKRRLRADIDTPEIESQIRQEE